MAPLPLKQCHDGLEPDLEMDSNHCYEQEDGMKNHYARSCRSRCWQPGIGPSCAFGDDEEARDVLHAVEILDRWIAFAGQVLIIQAQLNLACTAQTSSTSCWHGGRDDLLC
ncbi:hypothetical protein E2562_018601 [Oryza meyeriana var. granulata]|uniref:Uncharacterized protein n=1 Tax=Oryza meyeriana var. granulata TaxID=110450 RepID=A0A6G1F9J7_9ORYZ|nr:hypothetical protein E2562_018601 [Oryza meyeriana var. granulata]